jgi:heme oxygenase (mycobilin-producing)
VRLRHKPFARRGQNSNYGDSSDPTWRILNHAVLTCGVKYAHGELLRKGDTRMVIAVSNFTVANDEATSLGARFCARSRKVDRHAGFLGLEVWSRKNAGGTTFMLMSRWTCREALRSYLKSQDFRAVHANSTEEQAEFAVYELVAN